MTVSRRAFLGAGAATLATLAEARAGFTRALEAVHVDDFDELHAAYMLAPGVRYLNHASIGTIPRVVHQARTRYLELCETNPWLFMWGGAWERPREEVRAAAAKLLGAEPGEVAFTHNTTEAFNLLAQGWPLGKGDEVLFSSFNHPGASVAWEHHGEARGYAVRRFEFPLAPVANMTEDDVVEAYVSQVKPETRVVVLPHVDNIAGMVHPIARIARAVKEKGVTWVAVDGAQAVGMMPVSMADVDVYATSPHKWLQAPKGLGLMFVREAVQEGLRPMWATWGQRRWRSSARAFEDYGTRNLAEVLTLGDAISFQAKLEGRGRQARLAKLRARLRERVEAAKNLSWRSPTRPGLSSTVCSVQVHGQEAPAALAKRLFERHGIVVRPFTTDGLATLRVSPNAQTRLFEIDAFVDALK